MQNAENHITNADNFTQNAKRHIGNWNNHIYNMSKLIDTIQTHHLAKCRKPCDTYREPYKQMRKQFFQKIENHGKNVENYIYKYRNHKSNLENHFNINGEHPITH